MRCHRSIAVAAAGVFLLIDLGTGWAAFGADPTYPTGTFASGPTSQVLRAPGYDEPAAYAYVDVLSLTDDVTPAEAITLTLDPGHNARGAGVFSIDSSPNTGATTGVTSWMIGYDEAGVYVPEVTLTDGDGHSTIVAVAPITVVQDSTPPRVRVTLPRYRLRHSVRGWRYLHGTATDPQMPIFDVSVGVLQRRSGIWYAYNGTTQRWRRGSSSEAATRKRFGSSLYTQSIVDDSWRFRRLAGLRRGLLVIRASATDTGGSFGRAPEVRYRLRRW